MENEFRSLPLAMLFESKLNPRRHFDKDKLAELTESVKAQGVLEPILVRHSSDGAGAGYEIVAGARRFRAAKHAGLAEIPVRVVELDDVQVLEVMVTENGQRQDVHPLEEAQGFHLLHTRGKYDVARIAAKVGRSVNYVYNHLKLLDLTAVAQKLFLEHRFTAGHAVILARLSPEDQQRAIEGADGGNFNGTGGLWQNERLLFHPEDDGDGPEPLKPVSVKELQAWVDKHTKLEVDQVDQMVLPDTAAVLTAAAEEKERVVRITHETVTPEEAKDGPRVILGRSWQRADGQRGSKQCDRSVIGMVVIGPGRGEALRVCIDKKRCEVHWGESIKAAKKREREIAKGGATGEERAALRRKKEQAEQAKRAAEDARWQKAKPAILTAFETAIRKGSTGAAGTVGRFVMKFLKHELRGKASPFPTGKTGDELLRHLAYQLAANEVESRLTYDWGRKYLAEDAKLFGIDLAKILDQAAPVAAAAPAKKAKTKGPIARKKTRKAA